MATEPATEDTADAFPAGEDHIGLVAAALLVVVVLEGFLWTTTRVFVLNFSTAGPNATALLFVLLATGWSLAAVAALEPGEVGWYLGGGLLMVGFAVSLAGPALIAGLGAILMVTASTPLLAGLLEQFREHLVVGVAGGLLLTVALRVALDTASPYATTGGTVVFAGIVLGAAALPGVLATRGSLQAPEWKQVGTASAPLFALLFVAAGFLGSPHVVARWVLRSYELTVVALVVGVVAGLVVVRFRRVDTGAELGAWILTFLVGVSVMLYGTTPFTTGGIAVAWAAGIVLLAAGLQPEKMPDGSGAASLFGVQTLALLVLFGYVSASNWAFMPAPLDMTRGFATEFLLVFHAVFPLAVLLRWVRARTPSTPEPVIQSRRSVLGALAAGSLSIVALATDRYDPPPAPDESDGPLRVMAYNLHLFFEEGTTGQYNLEALHDVIADSDADIIAVSESDGCRPLSGNVDGLRWLGRELEYHTAFGAPTRLRSYGVGFLSRWPIEDVAVIELPVSRSPPRLAVTATIRTPNGPLPVLSTHFMTAKPGDVRHEQSRRVVDFAADHDRAVVLGDFNVEPDPDEPAYRILDEALTDAWVAADRTHGGPETFSAADPRRRIDYVWLQGEWDVREAAVVGSPEASDHLAVLADIEPSE